MSALQAARDILNPAAAKAREAAAKELERQTKERQHDIRWLMGDARGRRIVLRLLVRLGLFEPVTRSDPRATEHAAILRDEALTLFNELMAVTPDQALALFQADPVWRMHHKMATDAAKA